MSRQRVYSTVSEMEMAVFDVKRWGQVICALGAGGDHVNGEAVYVIGQAIELLGERIRDQWDDALKAAAEAKQCA